MIKEIKKHASYCHRSSVIICSKYLINSSKKKILRIEIYKLFYHYTVSTYHMTVLYSFHLPPLFLMPFEFIINTCSAYSKALGASLTAFSHTLGTLSHTWPCARRYTCSKWFYFLQFVGEKPVRVNCKIRNEIPGNGLLENGAETWEMWINGKNTEKLGKKKRKTEVATWLSNNNSLNKWLNEIYSRRKNEWICYKRTGVWCKQVWFRRCFNISREIFVKVYLSSIFYKKKKMLMLC